MRPYVAIQLIERERESDHKTVAETINQPTTVIVVEHQVTNFGFWTWSPCLQDLVGCIELDESDRNVSLAMTVVAPRKSSSTEPSKPKVVDIDELWSWANGFPEWLWYFVVLDVVKLKHAKIKNVINKQSESYFQFVPMVLIHLPLVCFLNARSFHDSPRRRSYMVDLHVADRLPLTA